MTNHRGTTIRYILLMLGIIVLAIGATVVSAQDQTVPTRTPTPDPSQNVTATPTDDSGGGGTAPTATQTSQSPGGATATATAPGGPAATATTPGNTPATATATGSSPSATTSPSAGSATPTTGPGVDPASGVGSSAVAGHCDPPTITVRDLTFVHAGPGSDFPLVGSLVANDTRLITGRAEFATWWQILLIETEPQLLGWVADGDHLFAGNMAAVEIVEPPPLNGATPTPGSLWQPTPLSPGCTPTPTATNTATPTVEPTPSATPTIVPDTLSTDGNSPSGIVVEGGSAAELDSQGSSIGKQLPEGESAASTTGTGGSAGASGASGITPLLVPLLGAALIAGGIALGLLSRARPPAG